jgi:hypothetical protein
MKEDLIRWLNPLNADVHISSGEEDELIEGDWSEPLLPDHMQSQQLTP